MSSVDKKNTSNIKKVLKVFYTIYHFVAEIFLYSILLILILVAIGFILYFIDMQKNIKNGTVKAPLFGAYIIISPSMEPTIKVEDAIVIMRQEPNELKKSDIITFLSSDPRYSGLTITHRIVGVEKSENGDIFYRTKGDNNNSEDTALVSSDNVYGKVILKIPKIGYIQYILTQAYGWVLLVVVPCLGIVIFDIIKLIKSIKGNKGENNPQKNSIQDEKMEIDVIGNDNNDVEIIGSEVEKDNLVDILEDHEDVQEDNDDIEIL